VQTLSDARAAARDLQALGPTAVLVKGGHITFEGGSGSLVDVLCVDDETFDLPTPRIDTVNTHGTGCTLASSIATYLARGAPVLSAVKMAQRYVAGVLVASSRLRLGGNGVQGAMDHGCLLCRQAALPPTAAPDYLLYVITDAGCNASKGRTMYDAVTAAIAGGATVIQVRCVPCAMSVPR
jgi:hydroxymethylpyrimidine kinase / phosphomethylpyrimidine kinase / thiamine-phosphate diphosphorylase